MQSQNVVVAVDHVRGGAAFFNGKHGSSWWTEPNDERASYFIASDLAVMTAPVTKIGDAVIVGFDEEKLRKELGISG
jgi:hypothetical protein